MNDDCMSSDNNSNSSSNISDTLLRGHFMALSLVGALFHSLNSSGSNSNDGPSAGEKTKMTVGAATVSVQQCCTTLALMASSAVTAINDYISSQPLLTTDPGPAAMECDGKEAAVSASKLAPGGSVSLTINSKASKGRSDSNDLFQPQSRLSPMSAFTGSTAEKANKTVVPDVSTVLAINNEWTTFQVCMQHIHYTADITAAIIPRVALIIGHCRNNGVRLSWGDNSGVGSGAVAMVTAAATGAAASGAASKPKSQISSDSTSVNEISPSSATALNQRQDPINAAAAARIPPCEFRISSLNPTLFVRFRAGLLSHLEEIKRANNTRTGNRLTASAADVLNVSVRPFLCKLLDEALIDSSIKISDNSRFIPLLVDALLAIVTYQ
jgi:hypothetical protein